MALRRQITPWAFLKEFQVITLAKSAKLLSPSLFNVIKGKLDRRKTAAHPSNVGIYHVTAEECTSAQVAQAATSASSQRHSALRVPRYPHGHGFIEATSMNRAGYVNVPAARTIVTMPSSKGRRITSIAERVNSGSSPKK
jgi:hypothetical protein